MAINYNQPIRPIPLNTSISCPSSKKPATQNTRDIHRANLNSAKPILGRKYSIIDRHRDCNG